MLYQRLQRKRILRLVVFTAAVALLCVLAQLSLSQGSLAAGAVLFEASAPQPETLCTLPASPSQALPSPQDFLHHALARNLSLPGGQQEEPAPQQEEPAPQKPFRIALTFDDGPGPYTGRLLDGLAQYNAKATFFVLGYRIPANETLLARMAAEGHEIGNHSYSHSLFQNMSQRAISAEIRQTADLVETACGVRPWLVRPPYGDLSSPVKEALSEPLVLWSVDPEDWKLRNADAVVRAVMSCVSDGDIVLLHDIHPTSVDAALILLERLSQQGYDFVTVSELFAQAGTPVEQNGHYRQAGPRSEAGLPQQP